MASSFLSAFQNLFQSKPQPPHKPTVADVKAVKTLLARPTRQLYIPVELVDHILDLAEYWASSKTRVTRISGTVGSGYYSSSVSEKMYLRSRPLGIRGSDNREWLERCQLWFNADLEPDENWLPPRTARPCRKIDFRVWAHDQGWSDNQREFQGTHHASFSWFNVCVDRVVFQKPPTRAMLWNDDSTFSDFAGSDTFERKNFPALKLVNNIHAKRETTMHDIMWHWRDPPSKKIWDADDHHAAAEGRNPLGGDFVRALEVGDSIVLYAKAMYPGWANTVEKAEVEVYWAV